MAKFHISRDIHTTSRRFSAAILWAVLIVVAGFGLQLILGPFDITAIAAPVNLFIGGAIVVLCAIAAPFADRRFVRLLTGLPLAVSLIGALGVLALIMGLTPQGAEPSGGIARAAARLGFFSMTSSWAFALVYLALLLVLGSVIARRIARWRWRDAGFYLNHIGLWLVLFAGGLGHADFERYVVQVCEGSTARVGFDVATRLPAELPVTVRLIDFVMEEYPPTAAGEQPQPKRFASEVEIVTPDGRTTRGVTEVNHPLRVGGRWIYQSGYDRAAGRESAYSILELVYDPWLVPVYTGFGMIALGAVAMIWNGRERAKKTTVEDGLE